MKFDRKIYEFNIEDYQFNSPGMKVVSASPYTLILENSIQGSDVRFYNQIDKADAIAIAKHYGIYKASRVQVKLGRHDEVYEEGIKMMEGASEGKTELPEESTEEYLEREYPYEEGILNETGGV